MDKFIVTGKDFLKKDSKGPSQRQLRVAEEIRHILADLFIRIEFRVPELQGQKFTITEVRMTPDLRHAIVYISHLGKSDVGDFLPALKRVAPYLRNQLSQKIRLKFLPDLRFQPDTTLDYAAKIDAVLNSPEVLRDLEKENQ
ncbi:30S ribosome-binding factor RbfA [Commensalibacter sp. M0402]|uniref:30S ribosome-binding factor RbfA n=1 Tax=Commensalibacter TaxID=1079922 RepID=UPI0018DDCB00|nr:MULTISPECIES: 30S ribosome-binding factor RbfA [Commensalibacter]MBI0083258.1 30S ribosome-binding factor RbfA [Commensalibacter sp. W6292M3]MBI0088495.1 30S ribosome-binding factor RbfA [Commensalibacter melissae]